MDKFSYFDSSIKPKPRDLLDIMESYKYLNSYLLNDAAVENQWDYATGWIELNMNREEWRSRPHHHK